MSHFVQEHAPSLHLPEFLHSTKRVIALLLAVTVIAVGIVLLATSGDDSSTADVQAVPVQSTVGGGNEDLRGASVHNAVGASAPGSRPNETPRGPAAARASRQRSKTQLTNRPGPVGCSAGTARAVPAVTSPRRPPPACARRGGTRARSPPAAATWRAGPPRRCGSRRRSRGPRPGRSRAPASAAGPSLRRTPAPRR